MLYVPQLSPTQIALAAEHRQRLVRLSPPKPPLNVEPTENPQSMLLDEYLKVASELEKKIAQLRQNITTGLRDLQSLRVEFERLQEIKVPIVRVIVAATCDHYGANLIDITSARKSTEIVFPRQVAMYLARKMTLLSLKSIGNYFGNRDHTTVKHAVEKIEALLETNGDGGKLQENVDQIRAKVMALETERHAHAG